MMAFTSPEPGLSFFCVFYLKKEGGCCFRIWTTLVTSQQCVMQSYGCDIQFLALESSAWEAEFFICKGFAEINLSENSSVLVFSTFIPVFFLISYTFSFSKSFHLNFLLALHLQSCCLSPSSCRLSFGLTLTLWLAHVLPYLFLSDSAHLATVSVHEFRLRLARL